MNKEKVDVGALLRTVNIVDIVGRYGVELHKAGIDYEGLCPFHSESTPSFTVSENKQFYHCFGCGAHGDAIGFVMEYEQLSFPKAAEIIANGEPPRTTGPITPKLAKAIKEEEKEWQCVLPVPDGVPPPKKTHSKREKKKNKNDPDKWIPLEFIAHFPYNDQTGALLGYISRFEYTTAEGKREKEYIPQTWRRNINTGELAWQKTGFPDPRPLYGLDRLAQKPNAIVILCEGEKKADAAERLLPAVVGMSFSGGSKAVKKTNFEPLRGRKVLLWRDADEPGLQAMDGYEDQRSGVRHPGVADMLNGIAAAIKLVDPPEGVAEGWDLWDAEKEGWKGADVEAHIRAALRLPFCLQPKSEEKSEQPVENMPPPSVPDDDDYDDEPEPYRALGYDHGRYYYLAGRAMQVVELSSSSHSKLNLMSIAPLNFWQMNYAAKNEVSWDMAANALMRQCENAGVYDSDKLRGRGAWFDGGRSLLHVGDRLIVDGESRSLTDPSVRYIYEAAPPLHLEIENPLSNKEAHEFVKLCQMLQWEKPVNGLLLAGWIMLAPICGALTWRPHIWITGAGGTGKSWVQSNIVVPCLGNTAIQPQGVATEAGIRQALGIDARPVTFDEAESEDQQAAQRMQAIMSLARQASSETGGSIIKGSANGRAMSYRIRSMFGFSSIGVGVQQYADKTRITVLSMAIDQGKSEEQRAADYKALQAKASDLLTEEYCGRLRARAVNMIGAIRENAKTFAAAGAAIIGSQRLGDQIGTILAGAFALHSNALISIEEARAWVEKQDWSDETSLHEVKDEQSCMAHIMQKVVRVSGQYTTTERSIGELVKLASDALEDDAVLKRADADDFLLRIGIKIIDDGVLVSNNHTGIKEILRSTPWAAEWGRILKRLPGAKPHKQERFGAGGSARSTFIPIEFFEGK